VEGMQEFWSLLYIPSKAPFGLFTQERPHSLKLYVKRVFIMDDCKDLLPNWLRFVSGVVDSEDLPLNVSREILQNNRIIANIKKHVVKKTLESLQTLAEDKPAEYASFWKEMGMVLKEGFYMNYEWLDELKSLLRFNSTISGTDTLTSLKDYVGQLISVTIRIMKPYIILTGFTRCFKFQRAFLFSPEILVRNIIFIIPVFITMGYISRKNAYPGVGMFTKHYGS